MNKQPCHVALNTDKDYFWCSCGLSKKQPFCDGSHKGTGKTPLKFSCDKAQKVYLCTCKKTARPPYCDGSHKHED